LFVIANAICMQVEKKTIYKMRMTRLRIPYVDCTMVIIKKGRARKSKVEDNLQEKDSRMIMRDRVHSKIVLI